jgi:hypothetical protein
LLPPVAHHHRPLVPRERSAERHSHQHRQRNYSFSVTESGMSVEDSGNETDVPVPGQKNAAKEGTKKPTRKLEKY